MQGLDTSGGGGAAARPWDTKEGHHQQKQGSHKAGRSPAGFRGNSPADTLIWGFRPPKLTRPISGAEAPVGGSQVRASPSVKSQAPPPCTHASTPQGSSPAPTPHLAPAPLAAEGPRVLQFLPAFRPHSPSCRPRPALREEREPGSPRARAGAPARPPQRDALWAGVLLGRLEQGRCPAAPKARVRSPQNGDLCLLHPRPACGQEPPHPGLFQVHFLV